MRLLIGVDVQKDFIDGVFTTPEAKVAVGKARDLIKGLLHGDAVIFTADMHKKEEYDNSLEGIKFPIYHCLVGTDGCLVDQSCIDICIKNNIEYKILSKNQFADKSLWATVINYIPYVNEIEFFGLCTDVCVISNIISLKTQFPNIEMSIHADCCAGTDRDMHKKALSVLNGLGVKIR